MNQSKGLIVNSSVCYENMISTLARFMVKICFMNSQAVQESIDSDDLQEDKLKHCLDQFNYGVEQAGGREISGAATWPLEMLEQWHKIMQSRKIGCLIYRFLIATTTILGKMWISEWWPKYLSLDLFCSCLIDNCFFFRFAICLAPYVQIF